MRQKGRGGGRCSPLLATLLVAGLNLLNVHDIIEFYRDFLIDFSF